LFGETQRWKSSELKSVLFTVKALDALASSLGRQASRTSDVRSRERFFRITPPDHIATFTAAHLEHLFFLMNRSRTFDDCFSRKTFLPPNVKDEPRGQSARRVRKQPP